MKMKYATAASGIMGAAIAFALGMFNDFSMADILFRMLILGVAGAWIGLLLSWLNLILPHQQRKGHHS